MSILDDLYREMFGLVGGSHKSIPDLWKRYLASLGHTQSTVLGQMKAYATANGISIVDVLESVATGAGATVPDAPTIGTATAGNAQATVTFTPPVNDGGAAITGYTVTSSPGGLTGTGAASPITVTGLTNGVAYTFTVTATNGVGTSAASAASNSVTPTNPNLIVNGTFANSSTWTLESGWSIATGQASHPAGSGGNIRQPFAFVSGGTYEVTYTVVSISGGSVNCRFILGSGANVTGTNRSTPGTYTEQLVASDHTVFAINAAAAAVCTIDNVEMYRIS